MCTLCGGLIMVKAVGSMPECLCTQCGVLVVEAVARLGVVVGPQLRTHECHLCAVLSRGVHDHGSSPWPEGENKVITFHVQ